MVNGEDQPNPLPAVLKFTASPKGHPGQKNDPLASRNLIESTTSQAKYRDSGGLHPIHTRASDGPRGRRRWFRRCTSTKCVACVAQCRVSIFMLCVRVVCIQRVQYLSVVRAEVVRKDTGIEHVLEVCTCHAACMCVCVRVHRICECMRTYKRMQWKRRECGARTFRVLRALAVELLEPRRKSDAHIVPLLLETFLHLQRSCIGLLDGHVAGLCSMRPSAQHQCKYLRHQKYIHSNSSGVNTHFTQHGVTTVSTCPSLGIPQRPPFAWDACRGPTGTTRCVL